MMIEVLRPECGANADDFLQITYVSSHEVCANYEVDKYDIGSGFGHFGIAVDNVAKTVDLIKAKGGIVTWELGPVKGGKLI
ncbi:hypothetical protein CTI12_AA317230 [Artemisia annua]|uniref:Glyoxalase/fosfomycin resistance/dioxygenase domain-containing protein n=1 Tax=Artemisia annua TaxID=35608 RepID=A0A2U1MXV7_ARTAN|nr:hypothetical protein CTI12_AA317230 [Artemisia annua]